MRFTMKSDHINHRKLYEVVTEDMVIEQAELEHLQTCDECLERIRVLVSQKLSKSPDPDQ
jgi:hypothetical protein